MRAYNFMNRKFLATGAMVFALLLSSQAFANDRIALVIGNGKYRVDPIKNAVADAQAIKNRLEALDFKVIYRENLAKENIESTLNAFRKQLTKGSVALFYYTGHAMQLFGTNYLISPFKYKVKELKSIPDRSINLNKVVAMMDEADTSLNLVLMDASRRAPVTRSLHRGSHGLAVMKVPASVLISYADKPGEYAADVSKSKHSRYTEGLLNMLNDINKPVGQGLKDFHVALQASSKGKYEPWLAGYTNASFVFNPNKDYNVARPTSSTNVVTHKLGDTITEPLVDMTFTYIEKGSFMMGSPETELHRYRDEELHKVDIEKGFWMGIHEVTFDQFKLFYETTSYTKPLDNHWGEGKRPVIMINWYEASSYANWLSGQTGKHYRLPTEAEWEYAARAGTNTAFFYGDDEQGFDEYAWNGENSGFKTQPVGLKKPNPWGLFDIHGNVWEWTSSLYSQEFDGSEKIDSSLEVGYDDRSARGGAWYFPPKGMRSADRRLYHPKQKVPYMGFRLVLEEE